MRMDVSSIFCCQSFGRRPLRRELQAIYGTESLNFISIPSTCFPSVDNDPHLCFKSYRKKMRMDVSSLFCCWRFGRRPLTRELQAIYSTESLNFFSILYTRFPSVDNDPHLCFKSCRKKLRLDAETFLGLRWVPGELWQESYRRFTARNPALQTRDSCQYWASIFEIFLRP